MVSFYTLYKTRPETTIIPFLVVEGVRRNYNNSSIIFLRKVSFSLLSGSQAPVEEREKEGEAKILHP